MRAVVISHGTEESNQVWVWFQVGRDSTGLSQKTSASLPKTGSHHHAFQKMSQPTLKYVQCFAFKWIKLCSKVCIEVTGFLRELDSMKLCHSFIFSGWQFECKYGMNHDGFAPPPLPPTCLCNFFRRLDWHFKVVEVLTIYGFFVHLLW